MTKDQDERTSRPEGRRSDAPETDEDRVGKEWSYLVLGLVVVALLLLVATGIVPVFDA